MKRTIFSALALAGLCLGSINQAQEIASTDTQSLIAEATDAFAVDMFRTLAQTQQGNLVFSPAGIEAVLCLLKQGARGDTAAELNALPLGQQGLLSAMNPDEANALFLADSFKLKPGLKLDSVYTVPFESNPADAAQIINNWANAHTHGRIPAIISQQNITPLTRLIAANAIYLNEKWVHPFKSSHTQQDALFTKADGSISLVDMMYNRADYCYAEGEDWQAVAMFYDTQGRIGEPGCFIGILPKGNARDFAGTLSVQKFQEIRNALANSIAHPTIVRMPRFEISPGTFSLVPALKACGLNNMFTPNADFSGFSNEPLCISEVLQRCYVKTDEEGTEAAAVTSAIIVSWAAPPPPVPPNEINFNRPFIWVIGDLNTNSAPYFMGIMEEP